MSAGAFVLVNESSINVVRGCKREFGRVFSLSPYLVVVLGGLSADDVQAKKSGRDK